ncbi:hypothetical protein AGMMS49975_16470 [Clostridia bacterium]|nr:hypothetical protein AGMMS49975_16390 [Clostridia bacterium]GHU55116.1 hypothetical protein AGMMS49975_16470 [Clostridia bacterium]
MNKQSMTEALRKSIDKCGVEVINNKKLLQAILLDFLPGTSYKKERMVLLHALEIDEWHLLLETNDKGTSEHNRALAVVLPQLQDVLGWTEERSGFILDCYTAALGWNDIEIKQPQKSPQPQVDKSTLALDDETRELLEYVKQLKRSSGGQLLQPQTSATTPPIQSTSKTNSMVVPVVGSTIKFGKYDWRVLDVQNGQALLVAKDATHNKMKYNENRTDVTWETCTLREWLNYNFFRSIFSEREQSRIALTTNINESNQWYGTAGGYNTQDRIFLLSISEVVKYFGDSGDLANKRKKDFKGNLTNIGYCLYDQYNSARIANYDGSSTWWWLRSPGISSADAALVFPSGTVNFCGTRVRYDFGTGGGVRPALWLNL